MSDYLLGLQPSLTAGAELSETSSGVWRLWLPAGEAKRYRLAQLDDYSNLSRRRFLHRAPTALSLRARASAVDIPGTWGFGLWNDPFSMGRLAGGGPVRLPAPPNTAWFFFASPPNYLTLRDDLPAQGSLAATFQSPAWVSALLPLGLLTLPLLAVPPAARLLRRLGHRFVRQSAVNLPADPTGWHDYRLDWKANRVSFQVDGSNILETEVVPMNRLGLVIWIDNQYLSFTPDGRLSYGLLASLEQNWIEISELSISSE
ncbi:MAG: hypothetical protein A2W35_13950 [Chloroflexi bacterium RBG_16_57_11]|nr:MAG: hypothetical protein A2W35_13950 [Chloroflexi bacterium RBG_16_57_11]